EDPPHARPRGILRVDRRAQRAHRSRSCRPGPGRELCAVVRGARRRRRAPTSRLPHLRRRIRGRWVQRPRRRPSWRSRTDGMSARRPALAVDLYTDAAIADPYPIYRAIRDLGPAVWLSAHGVWAVARFSDVRAALRADRVLVSGRGVAMNDLVNSNVSRVTLTTDGDVHRRLRTALMRPMMPSALKEVKAEIQNLADELVTRLAARESFDGIADFAQHLPLSVVSRLVGLPAHGPHRMLEWAAATLGALGVINERGQRAIPMLYELAAYAGSLERSQLHPDGWAAGLFAAADEGRIEPGDIAGMLIDYVAPSLDTTILG